jgi:hypothetical protein
MKSTAAVRVLFLVACLYDGLLGMAFLVLGPHLFEACSVTPPNHWGYVQFPAALLIIFALMFAAVSAKPVANRNLIPYGILMKLSYVTVVGYYWLLSGIPAMWKPFAVADLIFAILFLWAYGKLEPKPGAQTPEAQPAG